MPLLPEILKLALTQAFDTAMIAYETSIKNAIGDPTAVDPEKISTLARNEAAKAFAEVAAPAIDAYIKSATIVIPPGQAITGAGGGPVPVSGATVAPSLPAIIT